MFNQIKFKGKLSLLLKVHTLYSLERKGDEDGKWALSVSYDLTTTSDSRRCVPKLRTFPWLSVTLGRTFNPRVVFLAQWPINSSVFSSRWSAEPSSQLSFYCRGQLK
jgi:hypothetical protein